MTLRTSATASYLGIARSDDLVLIQITANNTRTVEQKKALFRRIAELLGESPGIRPEDVFGHGPRAIRLMRCDVPNAVHPPAAG
jgi:hypothetical protein